MSILERAQKMIEKPGFTASDLCRIYLKRIEHIYFKIRSSSNMEFQSVAATSFSRWRGNWTEKSGTRGDVDPGEFSSSCSWRSSSALQSCLLSWPSPPQPWCCHRICASPSNGSHTQQCDEAPETNVILVCMYLLYSDTIGIWGNSRSVTINDNSLYPITLHLYWIKRCTVHMLKLSKNCLTQNSNVSLCDYHHHSASTLPPLISYSAWKKTDLKPRSCDVALWFAQLVFERLFRRNFAVHPRAGGQPCRSQISPHIWLEVFGLLDQNQIEEGMLSPEAQYGVAHSVAAGVAVADEEVLLGDN